MVALVRGEYCTLVDRHIIQLSQFFSFFYICSWYDTGIVVVVVLVHVIVFVICYYHVCSGDGEGRDGVLLHRYPSFDG